MSADQAIRAGDGKPDSGWIHPGLGHPARPFAEWLNSQRMNDVSQVFHEIMARYCSALAAAPAAAPAWQPIETAPKDGTDILLSHGADVAQGKWCHEEPYIREKRDLNGHYLGQDESDGFDGWIDFIGGMLPEPTHWQPLPAAPSFPSPATVAQTEGSQP